MHILEIYEQFPITPTLQLHMLRAASVGAWIIDNWKEKDTLNKDAIITMLLLHDTANIVKFDLDNFPHLLGDELSHIDYWRQQQKLFIQHYGNDEHAATKAIAKEIGITGKALELLLHMGSRHIEEMAKGTDMEQKICMYGDLRVGPFGVLTVNERFDELNNRYKGRNHELADRQKNETKRMWCLEIEKQLQAHVATPLTSITDETIKEYMKSMEHFDIATSPLFSQKI